MRDDAFAQLGDTTLADGVVQGSAPAFTVDSVENLTPDQDSQVARRITGHFTVPCYIAPTCEPPTKCDQITQGVVRRLPDAGAVRARPDRPRRPAVTDSRPDLPGQLHLQRRADSPTASTT